MLRKSQGNMYSWVTHTWNTIKGECPHGCTYCYMKQWGKQNPPRFDYNELKTDLGEGNIIFVGSSCDMFADVFSEEWMHNTLQHCKMYPNNTYLFQSKNVKRMSSFYRDMPDKVKLCTTIETNRWYFDVMGNSPPPVQRMEYMAVLPYYIDKYVTIEPVMEFDLPDMVRYIKECEPIQVNIGADSKGHNLPEPSKEKLLALIDELQKFTVIDKKTNLNRLLK